MSKEPGKGAPCWTCGVLSAKDRLDWNGADVNSKDNAGRTPADQMLQSGRRDLADILRRHGGESS